MKRIPATSRDADAELSRSGPIGKAMWVKDSAAAQGAMLAHAWSQPLVSGLVARLQREHMSRTFAEIAKACSLIRAESGARALGQRRESSARWQMLPDGPWMRRAAPTSLTRRRDREETADDGAAADVDGLRRTHREGGQVAEQMRWDQ